MDIFVLESSLKTPENLTLPNDLLFIFEDGKWKYSREFSYMREQQLKADLENLKKYIKNEKLKVTGFIIYRGKDNKRFYKTTFSRYKIKTDEIDLRFTVKKPKPEKEEPARRLTIEEKFEMLREYVKENNRIPTAEAVYKGFKIGLFVYSLNKDKEHVRTFEQIARTIEHD